MNPSDPLPPGRYPAGFRRRDIKSRLREAAIQGAALGGRELSMYGPCAIGPTEVLPSTPETRSFAEVEADFDTHILSVRCEVTLRPKSTEDRPFTPAAEAST